MGRLQLEAVFSRRILPSRQQEPQIKKLSILDNSASFYPKNRALFVYDHVPAEGSTLTAEHLASSLAELLSEQPFWAGQLQFTEFRLDGGYQHRLGCLEIKYGEKTDPGVSFKYAKTPLRLCESVPSFEECLQSKQVFHRFDFPFDECFNTEPLAMDDPNQLEGAPILSVQVIQFACGGIAVAIIVPHYLADAATFSHIIDDYARVTRGESTSSLPTRYFEAAAVDGLAGDMSPLATQRVDRQQLVRRHFQETYDMWASVDNAPASVAPACIPPKQIAHLAEPFGKPVNWSVLDYEPSQCCQIFIPPEELHHMYMDASANGQIRISHLDALNAHLWLETCAANNLKEGEVSEFGFPLDLRRRANLPSGQIGNIVTAKYAGPIDAKNTSISQAASLIRATILAVTPGTISDTIFCMAFEATPSRYIPWAPKGNSTINLSSWLTDDIAGTDFGVGKPRYFDTRPSISIPNFHLLTTIPCGDPTRSWYERGVIVTSFLKKASMENFSKSTTLRKYSIE